MDYKPYCAGIPGVTHPPYTKTPPEMSDDGPFFWRKSENGAFSAEKADLEYGWIVEHTALRIQVLRTRHTPKPHQ
jgi:hypothetical protein